MLLSTADIQATATIITSWRPVAVVLFPLAAALLVLLAGRTSKAWAGYLAAASSVVTFGLVLSLYPLVQQGVVEFRFVELMRLGLLFRVDLLGFIFAFLVALGWMLVLLYATAYMEVEKNTNLYYIFSLVTLGSCLGVMVTGDLVSLFLFFEMMTFSSYVLVIGRLDREAMMAGTFYLFLGVAGGLVLLFGIFALFSVAQTVEIIPLMEYMVAEADPLISPGVIFGCFLIGFGIKAGVVPLHLWMPRAYAAAPAVVNALSSGAMIKAGVYGILRILLLVFSPPSLEMESLFQFATAAGYIVMWLGLLTMVAGAVMALWQENIMKLLAYSSISQVGYMVTGLGAAAYLFQAEEAMGFSGAVLHAFNHTLFKVAFFLIVGIIFFRTGQLEMKKLGGLAKKMPLLTGFFILSVLAIAGIPGLNGYISKTLIHDALLEAYKLYGGFHLDFAEKVFKVGSALTLCYYLKFFQGVFLGPEPAGKTRTALPRLLYLPLGVLSLLMIVVGLAPNRVVEGFVLAATRGFTFAPDGIQHIVGFQFFDSYPLWASGQVVLLALVLYLPLTYWKLYERPFPHWFSIEYMIFAPLSRLAFWFVCRSGKALDISVNSFYLKVAGQFMKTCSFVGNLDSNLDQAYEKSSSSAFQLLNKTRQFDDALNTAYERTGNTARDLADRTTRFDGALNKAYESTGKSARQFADRTTRLDRALDKTYEDTGKAARNLAGGVKRLEGTPGAKSVEKTPTSRLRFRVKPTASQQGQKEAEAAEKKKKKAALNPLDWSIKNINFDQLLMAVMLGIIIFILFYFARGLVSL